MSWIVIPNVLQGQAVPTPPRHADGSTYPFAMYLDESARIVFADTHVDLLDALIEGYAQMDPAERDQERIGLAQHVAAVTQAQAMFDHGITRDDVTDQEWNALTAPRGQAQPRVNCWTSEVPLVVVETSYQPHTTVPRPTSALSDATSERPSNLAWVRPGEEGDFLASLHELSYIQLLHSD